MKSLKYWILKWLTNNNSRLEEGSMTLTRLSRVKNDEYLDNIHGKTISFRLWFAAGGKVVQTQRYDSRKDENQSSLYIITDEQNFGEEIDKILTLEALRQ
jgi:hypothetical protein